MRRGLVRGLTPALQDTILARAIVRSFNKGQVVSLEETAAKGLFAVLEGHVRLVRDLGAGEEALLHVAEPGFWFGEFAVMTGRPTVVTALAHSPVRALVLSKTHFDQIVADEPRYYAEFARLAFERYEALLHVLSEAHGLSPESRLRRRLAAMARQRQQDQPSGDAPIIDVSQADLARMVGISRQTLNVLLGKLHELGLVDAGFRRIRVLDSARLLQDDLAAENQDARPDRPGTRGASSGTAAQQRDVPGGGL